MGNVYSVHDELNIYTKRANEMWTPKLRLIFECTCSTLSLAQPYSRTLLSLKIKLKLTKRLMLKRQLMCIVCVFCRLSTKSKHVPSPPSRVAVDCFRSSQSVVCVTACMSLSEKALAFYENVLYHRRMFTRDFRLHTHNSSSSVLFVSFSFVPSCTHSIHTHK